jgi:predicted PurR-regulated permease PerM
MTQTSESMRSVRGAIVFAFAMALILYLAWNVRSFLVLLYVSVLFAVVLTPVVRATAKVRIYKWRPFQGAAAIFILLLLAAMAVTLFGFLALPPVIRDLHALIGEMPARVPVLLDRFKQIPFASRLESADVIAWMQNSLSAAIAYLLFSIKDWAGIFLEVIAGFVMTLYFILEGDHAYRWFLSFIPSTSRQRFDRTLRLAAVRMQKWLLGQLCLMLILGALSTVVYLAFHVRYAYALGVLTGLLNVVPVLGAAIAIVLALLIAAVDSWVAVAGVAVFYGIYLQIENSFLIPHIMKSRVNLPALAIFAALLLGSELEGVVGAMVSIPTAVLVAVLLDEYLVQKD